MRSRLLLFAPVMLLGLACGGDATPTTKPGGAARYPVVVLDTSMGAIKVELYPEKAPRTVANFLRYVDSKHYDNTIFHRVIPHFMIQGGGFTSLQGVTTPQQFQAREKPTGPPIPNESGNGLANLRGTIAMARTEDLDSATAQFFINVEDKPHLDEGRYCVFGKVIDGMEVVDTINAVPTRILFRGLGDVPADDVVIKSIRRAP
jgi:cyclophilin family peptidyl-prolyl cis-trans isomerase